MAIVMSSSSLVETLTDVGARSAIIQNPLGYEERYLNAGWWLAFGRAVATYCVIFLLAPWVARFYGNPELTGLLRVTLLATLFNGAMSPRSILPQREMNFGRWALINNGGGVCGVVLTIVLSFLLRDVWALALGYCSENAFRCVYSYILCPGWPTARLDSHALRDLLKFSRGVFGLGFLTLLFTRTDVFVLGKLFPATALGLYAMSIGLVMTPSTFVTGVIGQTLPPAFCRVQNDNARLNRILLEVTSWLTFLGLPAAAAICLCNSSILSLAYGSRYAAGAATLSYACGVVMITVVNAPFTSVLIATGNPGQHRLSGAATAAVMMISIYPACRYLGTTGGQVAALPAVAVGYVFQIFSLRRITKLSPLEYAGVFLRSGLKASGVVAIVLAARLLGIGSTPVMDVALCFGACVTVYAVGFPFLLRTMKTKAPAVETAEAYDSSCISY
jgi:PST family polysaccharide transporter/lipopolysaccharide exporter